MLPKTTSRVTENTAQEINERIRRNTDQRVTCLAAMDDQAAINRQLEDLDREWDIERALEAMASSISLTTLALGVTRSRMWLVFPPLVLGFLLQHALQGWCPPIPVLRRLGFRTASEIDYERYALKALRGDFRELAVPPGEGKFAQEARAVLDAVRA